MLQKTIGQILPKTAEKYGEKTALICGKREVSFSELDKLSNQVANSLAEIGIVPGDRVTLYAPNSWEWVVSYYGIAKTGAVLNPINVMLTPKEVAYVVKDCGAKALFTTNERALPILNLKKEGVLKEIITFGPEHIENASPFDDLIKNGGETFTQPPIEATSLSTICYT